MFRILFYLFLVFALGLGFAWLADRPGDIVVTFGGYQYQATLMVSAVIVVALLAVAMLSWWLIKNLWNSPYTLARYFRVRRRDRGYQALSTGMIAAGAGDAGLARSKKKEAMKLISADQEPLIHLLDAQASLLEGDHDAAREKFTAMLDDPETRLLGLRGLYLEAARLGDRTVARHYAARAVALAPQLGWAAEATLEDLTGRGDWEAALRVVDAQKSTRQIEREAAHRRKAVLLTAKAMAEFDADPATAKADALEANRLAPDLVPAAVTAARAAFRLDDLRKGARILETIWKKEPHPQVADAFVHARHGDSTHDRLDRALRLRSIKQNNAESELAVARAALEAGEFAMAREAAQSALRMSPREGAYLLMADIEEAQTGDNGMVREWLSRAVRAPRDPAWVADGYVSEQWAPVSPVTGRLDAFEWRTPVERLGQVIEEYRAPEPRVIAAPAPPLDEAPEAIVIEAEPEPEDVRHENRAQEPEPVADPEPEPGASTSPDAKAVEMPEPPADATATDADATAADAPVATDESAQEDPDRKPPERPWVPDDPGVDPKDDRRRDENGRFRLF